MAGHADSRLLTIFAALFVVSGAAYARLPSAVVSPALIAFLLPTAAVAIFILLRLLAAHDPLRGSHHGTSYTYDAIVFRVVLFVGALHGIVLLGLFGRGFMDRAGPIVPRLAPVLLGVGLIAIGNLLPRVRPNVAFGIRTSRTLRDRGSWFRANRRAGYVAVALGFAIVMAAMFVPPGPRIAAVVGVAGIIAVVTLVAWTWRDVYDRSDVHG